MEKAEITTALCFSFGLVFFMLFLIGFSEAATSCYQESANVVNQSGNDGSCNLDYTGSYSFYYDYFYVNYTKPVNATSSSLWKVKHGNYNIQNLTIPADCWNAYLDKLAFRMESNSNDGLGHALSNLTCWNGNGWKQLSYSYGIIALPTSNLGLDNRNELYDGNWDTGSGNDGNWDTGVTRPWRPSFSIASTSFVNRVLLIYEEAMIWEIDNGGGKGAETVEEVPVPVIQETAPAIITPSSPIVNVVHSHKNRDTKLKDSKENVQTVLLEFKIFRTLEIIYLNGEKSRRGIVVLN
jgi:hypothetical protein